MFLYRRCQGANEIDSQQTSETLKLAIWLALEHFYTHAPRAVPP